MTNQADRLIKGVLGEKLGMTQVWDAAGRLVPVTVVQAVSVRRHPDPHRRPTATTPSRSRSAPSTPAR
jgi:hypothetical protein